MAGNRVRGITIEIGGDTTQLDKALTETDKQLKKTQTSLKDVERLLKLDPGNVELLTQKQRLLADAVAGTQERLRTLETAAEQASEALASGQISQDQYDALQREIIETQHDLEELTRTANDFDIDRAIQDAEERLNDLRDAAEDADDSMDDLTDSSDGASGGLGRLKGIAGGVAIAIGQKLVEAAISAAQWIWTLDEATEEYRAAMGKLNTAFEVSGFSAEAAKEAYQGFYNILGDTDTATEASQLLAQLIDNEEDIAKWTKIAAGVYGTFGDSLPIEGLIEAANETAKTGQVTGALADALNWVGMSEDEFNESLAKTTSEGERARLIMGNLTTAYGEAADAFYENNETLIETREAQAELNETQAKLGESIADLKNKFFDLFGPWLIEAIKFTTVALEGIIWVVNKIGEGLAWLADKIQFVLSLIPGFGGASKKLSSLAQQASAAGGGSREGAYSLRPVTAESLPYLAQGTVTRPNSPFMAVVGDNPMEPEIVSPYSTIKQAALDAFAEAGGQTAATRVTVNFTGSLAQFVRMLQPQITAETVRRGPQYVK